MSDRATGSLQHTSLAIDRLWPARILLVALAMAFCLIPADRAAALITVGALDTPESANDVEVIDGLAYVADGGSGMRRRQFGRERPVLFAAPEMFLRQGLAATVLPRRESCLAV